MYSYNATVPINYTEEEVREYVRKDLSHWLEAVLGISVRRESVQVPTLVLIKKGSTNSYRTKSNLPFSGKIDGSKNEVQLENYSIADVVNYFNSTNRSYYMVNETGIDKNARATLELPITNDIHLVDLKRALSQYGLDVIDTTRTRLMYVITEKSYMKAINKK